MTITKDRAAYATIAHFGGYSVTFLSHDGYTNCTATGYSKDMIAEYVEPETPVIRCDLSTLDAVLEAIKGNTHVDAIGGHSLFDTDIGLDGLLDKYRAAGVPIQTAKEYLGGDK